MAVNRNSGAIDFIPSEDEWYKAAYYKSGGTNAGYWLYPTQNNTAPMNTLPDTGNHANFNNYTGANDYTDPTNLLTPVGDFILSPGPYGTFDQGGDIYQWIETDFDSNYRDLQGGSFHSTRSTLAMISYYRDDDGPADQNAYVGFRVASAVPEPGALALLAAGAMGLAAYGLRRKWAAKKL